MRPFFLFAIGALAALACHNQSTDDDRGQAVHGKTPDTVASPPRPVVAGSASPVSSVAAANLARTASDGPPNHDGPVACHLSVGNATPEGRPVSTQNAGNVPIRTCSAVIYAYGRNRDQIARVEVQPLAANDGGPAHTLAPRDGLRTLIPLAPAIANDPGTLLVPVVTHVEFADGVTWDAPPARAPAHRAYAETERGGAVN